MKNTLNRERLQRTLDSLNEKDPKIEEFKQTMMNYLTRHFAGKIVTTQRIIHCFKEKIPVDDIKQILDELLNEKKIFPVRWVALKLVSVYIP